VADHQLDFFGGSTLTGPPKVPTVIFHPRSARRHIRSESRVQCGHCLMNARNWHDNPASVPQWAKESQIIILQAVLLITQRDGSTLYLCAQHAQEHEERKGNDG
jgi:hypothetical protein